MSEFLAESFVPRAQATAAAPGLEDLSRAAAQLTHEGTKVRLKRSIVVPEEETCFYLFEAVSEDAVREAAARSGLRFERIGKAVSGWPDEPKPLDMHRQETK
jgi:hypothetical protein